MRTAIGPMAAAGAAGLAYSALWERNAFVLRTYDVPVLANGSAPLRLLHLSDIHMLGRQLRKQAWIRDLARLVPDLVVLTGDNLSGVDGMPAVLAALGPLLHRPGAFVLGSNDYFAPLPKNPAKYLNPRHTREVGAELPSAELARGLSAHGWVDLTNRIGALSAGGRPVALRGVDDPHLGRHRLADVAGQADVAAAVRVGLVHAPEPAVLQAFSALGDDLLLCGHTHGGQLRIPGVGALVTNCGIDRARCRGLSRFDASWLHVSAGLGTGPYAPFRFACRPEASLLTLVPRSADPAVG